MNYYTLKRKIETSGPDTWRVVRISTGKVVFYGTKGECQGWIERNGHDPDAE